MTDSVSVTVVHLRAGDGRHNAPGVQGDGGEWWEHPEAKTAEAVKLLLEKAGFEVRDPPKAERLKGI